MVCCESCIQSFVFSRGHTSPPLHTYTAHHRLHCFPFHWHVQLVVLYLRDSCVLHPVSTIFFFQSEKLGWCVLFDQYVSPGIPRVFVEAFSEFPQSVGCFCLLSSLFHFPFILATHILWMSYKGFWLVLNSGQVCRYRFFCLFTMFILEFLY